MNDGSKLTYAQMANISQNLKSNATSMDAILTEIKSYFEKIGNDNVWSGTTASAAKDEFNRLSSKFAEFTSAINDESAYINQVIANYQAVDQKLSQ